MTLAPYTTLFRSTTLGTTHTVILTGLADGTYYHFKVMSKAAANDLATSSDAPFTTLDTTAPVISGVVVSAITGSGATIIWTTKEAARSEVEYGMTTAYGSAALNTTVGTTHTVILTGLADGTTYHYYVASK